MAYRYYTKRIDRKLVEDEVIKGIIDQLTLEGIKGEISAINGIELKDFKLIKKYFYNKKNQNFLIF